MYVLIVIQLIILIMANVRLSRIARKVAVMKTNVRNVLITTICIPMINVMMNKIIVQRQDIPL